MIADDTMSADRAWRLFPIGDDIAYRGIARISRFDQSESTGMCTLHFHGITGVVLIHGERRDENGAVNTDLVHCSHHLGASNVIGPVRHLVPWSLGRICLVGMYL